MQEARDHWTHRRQYDLMFLCSCVERVQEVEKQVLKSGEDAKSETLFQRLCEILLFIGVIALSCLVVIAVALAAPFVLAGSAIAGLVSRGGAQRGWRSAGV